MNVKDLFILLHDPSPDAGYFSTWVPLEKSELDAGSQTKIENRLSTKRNGIGEAEQPLVLSQLLPSGAFLLEYVQPTIELCDDKGRSGLFFSVFLRITDVSADKYGVACTLGAETIRRCLDQARSDHRFVNRANRSLYRMVPGISLLREKRLRRLRGAPESAFQHLQEVFAEY